MSLVMFWSRPCHVIVLSLVTLVTVIDICAVSVCVDAESADESSLV